MKKILEHIRKRKSFGWRSDHRVGNRPASGIADGIGRHLVAGFKKLTCWLLGRGGLCLLGAMSDKKIRLAVETSKRRVWEERVKDEWSRTKVYILENWDTANSGWATRRTKSGWIPTTASRDRLRDELHSLVIKPGNTIVYLFFFSKIYCILLRGFYILFCLLVSSQHMQCKFRCTVFEDGHWLARDNSLVI